MKNSTHHVLKIPRSEYRRSRVYAVDWYVAPITTTDVAKWIAHGAFIYGSFMVAGGAFLLLLDHAMHYTGDL